MSQITNAPLGKVASINPALIIAPEITGALVDFLPMSALDADKTIVFAKESRLYSDVQKGYTSFANGDVLLAKITPCFENGKIAQASIASSCGFGSTEFHVLRPKEGLLDARYLVHFLRRDEVRVDGTRKMTGSGGQRRVPKHYLESLEIPLPPLPEQRRIAAILDQADALRAKRREALAQLDKLAQAIFVEMFGRDSSNKMNMPMQPLKSLGKVVTGRTPSSAKTGMFNGTVPFITPGDLESHLPVKRTVTEAGAQDVGTVRKGAALVCCIGSVGKMGMASERSAFNQQINAVEWYETIDDIFGLYALATLKNELASSAASTTVPILNKSAFEKFALPVPPMNLQREFSERITAIDSMRRHHERSAFETEELFTALQSRAFRGEL